MPKTQRAGTRSRGLHGEENMYHGVMEELIHHEDHEDHEEGAKRESRAYGAQNSFVFPSRSL